MFKGSFFFLAFTKYSDQNFSQQRIEINLLLGYLEKLLKIFKIQVKFLEINCFNYMYR